MTHRTNNEHNHYEDNDRDYHRNNRRQKTGPWFWLIVAALVIVPTTAFAIITHDNFTHAMERQGCHIINTFESGSHVWSCPRDVR